MLTTIQGKTVKLSDKIGQNFFTNCDSETVIFN